MRCSDQNAWKADMSEALIQSYGLKCAGPGGCATCAQTNRSKTVTVSCYGDSIISDINDAVYGAEDEQPPFYFDGAAAMCNVTSRSVPVGAMCRHDNARVIRAVKRRCLGRQNCKFRQSDLAEMFPLDPCPGHLKRLTVIAQCAKSQVPLAADDMASEGEFAMTHFESRRLSAASPAVSTDDAYQMRVQFQYSPTFLASQLVDNFTGVVWGTEKRSGGNTRKIHRLMGTFTVPSFMGANGTHFWLFRVRGRQFWKEGGVLSIMQPSMEKDFACGGVGCKLGGCRPDPTDPDSCVFEARLPGESSYYIFLYGITRDEEHGAAVTLEWKPPSTCTLYDEGCLQGTGSAGCLKLGQGEMPWLPIKQGAMPWIMCRTPWAAEVTRIDAATKPFCMDTTHYGAGQSKECWPSPSPPSDSGCEGTYDASDGTSEGVMFARVGGTQSAAGGNVHMIIDGERCRTTLDPENPVLDASHAATHASALGMANDIRKGRVGYLRFEEGPCGGAKALFNSTDLASSPHHKLRCTANTYGGDGTTDTDATVYSYPTDEMGASKSRVVGDGLLREDASGDGFVHPGHSGNYAVNFDADPMRRVRALVVLVMPSIAHKVGVRGNRGTVTMWYKKLGAIAAGDETLMSWASEHALERHSQTPDVTVVKLRRGGVLSFWSVEENDEEIVDVNTLKVVSAGWKKECVAESAAIPELADGRWHLFAVAINAAKRVTGADGKSTVKSMITFNVDGAAAEHEIVCKMFKPVIDHGYLAEAELGGAVSSTRKRASSKLGALPIPDKFNDLDRNLDNAGTGKEPFYWRDELNAVKARTKLLIGAAYDAYADSFAWPSDAVVDSVSAFDDVALTAAELDSMGAEIPCAMKFTGRGFAFFPGTAAVHGPETLKLSTGDKRCNPGPHSVRFRYLAAQGNNRQLTVKAQGSEASVGFGEPEGLNEDSVDVWQVSGSAQVEMGKTESTEFEIGWAQKMPAAETSAPEYSRGASSSSSSRRRRSLLSAHTSRWAVQVETG